MNRLQSRVLPIDNAGLSLVELVVAAGVLSIGFTLLAGSLTSIVATGKQTEMRQAALAQTSCVLEELRGMSFDEVVSYEAPDMRGLGDDVAITLECYDASGTAVSLPTDDEDVIDALPNPLEVRVTVTWKERAGVYLSKHSSTMIRR